MPAFEFLRLVKETSYGTPMANPVAGVDSLYVRLTEGDSYNVQSDPQMADIMYGGGEALVVETVSDVTEVKGRLQTKLYPTQAAFFLGWLTTRVNEAQTLPWPTTEPPGDLASVSIYHAYQRSDGTLRRTRDAGCKVASFEVSASRGDPIWKLSIDVVAQRTLGNPYDGSTDPDAAEFPAPADADLPLGPYLFSQSAGGLLLGVGAGTIRTQYDNLSLKFTNRLDARPFESRFLQVCSFRGRTGSLGATKRLKALPDDRTAFEAVAAQRAQLTLTAGPRSIVFDLHGAGKMRKLTRQLPLDKVFMEQLEFGTARDATAGTDLTVTVT